MLWCRLPPVLSPDVSPPPQVTGRCGSVLVRLIPAPRGTGIVSAPVPKKLLMMAGIDDCYTSARGCTATLGNFGRWPASQLQLLSAPLNHVLYVVGVFSERESKALLMHDRLARSGLFVPRSATASISIWGFISSEFTNLLRFSLFQPRPLLMPFPRPTVISPLTSGKRQCSPSLHIRY